MKFILFTIFACLAMTAQPHPFLGLDIAAGIGEGLGKAVGTGVALGLGTAANIGAGALGLGAGVVNGIANGVENGLGLRSPAQIASRNIEQSRTQGEAQNDSEEAGAYSEESHKKSEKNYHDRAHHHSTITTITRVENSDEHDIGGSQAGEQSDHASASSKAQSSARGAHASASSKAQSSARGAHASASAKAQASASANNYGSSDESDSGEEGAEK